MTEHLCQLVKFPGKEIVLCAQFTSLALNSACLFDCPQKTGQLADQRVSSYALRIALQQYQFCKTVICNLSFNPLDAALHGDAQACFARQEQSQAGHRVVPSIPR